MRKIFLLAVLSYVIACNSPESSSETITNSPPGFTTDTSGGARMDSTITTDTLNGANRTGPDSTR